jgi:diphosphomevalonate decarboxylase
VKKNIINRFVAAGFSLRNEIKTEGFAFAPSNIALIKYWGKRNAELNLPYNSSLSISLGNRGAFTKISPNENPHVILLNGQEIPSDSSFASQIIQFLELFREVTKIYYRVDTTLNIPKSAGLASSACGFAALVKALNHLHNWQLNQTQLSILARMGSGSACRSLWHGFVEWRSGNSEDGLDSFGVPLDFIWPELRIGLLIVNEQKKAVSSREAMARTVATAKDYKNWPARAEQDLVDLKGAIANLDFVRFGEIAEQNALLMHELMLQAKPPIDYASANTLKMREMVWSLRNKGIPIYFTQDAGANLKLLFLEESSGVVRDCFPDIEIIAPFANPAVDQVVLVSEDDKEMGVYEKLAAHQTGKLHRAFSVVIWRKNGDNIEVLLQRRNRNKYHSGGLWSNACCSHPKPGEDIVTAAARRLYEELGIKCDLQPIGKFHYQAEVGRDLVENEMDYVLVGFTEGNLELTPDPKEIEDFRWVDLFDLQRDLCENLGQYTAWLGQVLSLVQNFITLEEKL